MGAQLQLEKEREERERKAAEERERLNEEERKIAEEKEKEEREREEREREEREREELLMPDEEPAELEPEVPMPSQDAEMKVRKDYVRHKKASQQRLMQRCPITGQLIPAEEMSNHLKVLLLDPKWKHQKDALVERARKESAFADDVEANLASFVAKRPDLFGSVDEQIREAAEAGAEAAARDAGADAGPAHTMVPPTAQLTGGAAGSGAKAALPSGSGGTTTTLAGLTAGGAAGPVTGVSTINARLPSAALPPPMMAPPQSGPPQLMAAEEDDSEDE